MQKFEDANDINGNAPNSTIDGEHSKSARLPDKQTSSPPSLPPRTSIEEKLLAEGIDGQDTSTEESTARPSASPLLTAHRMSRDSTVTAEDDVSVTLIPSITTTAERDPSAGRPTKPLPRPSRFQGFSAALPSVPWAAPPKAPAVPARERSPQFPPGMSRKPTNPFAWLGRAASKDVTTPPLPAKSYMEARRNTAASISTIGSNPDLNLRALDDGQENGAGARPPARTSLREKFKLLRMQEEAGIMATSLDDSEESQGGAIAGLVGRTTSLSIGIASPESMTDNKEEALKPPMLPHSPVTDGLPSPTINPNLAPGQVQGVAESAADAGIPIDWDFWQTVVNEGPAAVARTSPEELTAAIAGGIPQTIRGVIWQVLASSKNEELELVYHDLLNNGANTDGKEVSNPSTATNGAINGGLKESIASSSSSVHSESSTPATSANIGVVSPSPSHETADQVNGAKLQGKLIAERQKKAKDDAVALSKLEKMIKRDMGARTSYSKYAVAAGFQDGLFNVCKAYALFDEAVGYPQGMNFIIMPILFTMPEEEAFCLVVRLMNKYQLRDLFIQDMPGLHLHLYQFERLLEDLEPALYCHLNRRQVTPKLYATQWFLTMFAYRFPLQLVMRVFDLVLSEGLEGAILKFGMAVIQRNVSQLLAMNDMMALTNFLKEKLFDVYIDAKPSSNSILESGFFGMSGGTETEVYRADLLVQDACAVKVTPEQLNKYREEWEEKLTTDKARDAEIDNYRTTIATQTAKIRSLEDRASLADTEHVQIASDLVRLKVDNQELVDSNESLKGQVEELKKVAESEARNVEERLKAEMERVMTRNIEVQNENRHMEEGMAEMERDLVETKMKYAEVSAKLMLVKVGLC
jgi:hypothetical protein